MECNIQVLLLRLKCTYQGRIPHPFPGKFNGFYIGFQKGIPKKTLAVERLDLWGAFTHTKRLPRPMKHETPPPTVPSLLKLCVDVATDAKKQVVIAAVVHPSLEYRNKVRCGWEVRVRKQAIKPVRRDQTNQNQLGTTHNHHPSGYRGKARDWSSAVLLRCARGSILRHCWSDRSHGWGNFLWSCSSKTSCIQIIACTIFSTSSRFVDGCLLKTGVYIWICKRCKYMIVYELNDIWMIQLSSPGPIISATSRLRAWHGCDDTNRSWRLRRWARSPPPRKSLQRQDGTVWNSERVDIPCPKIPS